MDSVSLIATPIIQYGFAGLSIVLLGFLAWLVKRLLSVLERTTGVIEQNTNVISCLKEETDESKKIIADIRDKLMSRPCIAKGEK